MNCRRWADGFHGSGIGSALTAAAGRPDDLVLDSSLQRFDRMGDAKGCPLCSPYRLRGKSLNRVRLSSFLIGRRRAPFLARPAPVRPTADERDCHPRGKNANNVRTMSRSPNRTVASTKRARANHPDASAFTTSARDASGNAATCIAHPTLVRPATITTATASVANVQVVQTLLELRLRDVQVPASDGEDPLVRSQRAMQHAEVDGGAVPSLHDGAELGVYGSDLRKHRARSLPFCAQTHGSHGRRCNGQSDRDDDYQSSHTQQ